MVISGTPIISHTKRLIPQCTRYLAKTSVYDLPILSGLGLPGGPFFKAEICEKRFADISENQLKGAIDAHGRGIFEIGDFSTDDDAEEVRLSDFRGVINSIFIENFAEEDVVWAGIDLTKDQYLFIGLIEEGDGGRDDYKSSRQFGEFVTRVGDTAETGQKEIILAKRPAGLGASVDINVPNRLGFKTVDNHVFGECPHGGLWIQTEAVVSGIAVREELDIVDVGTVNISGVFGNVNRPPGKFIVNEDLTTSGLTAEKILMDSAAIFESLSQFKDKLLIEDILIVESGVNVFGSTRVHDHWEFNDQRSVSGVGFRTVSGDSHGTLAGNGKELVVFDPSDHGSNLDDHLSAINPHRLTASGVAPFAIMPDVLSIFGDTMIGNLSVDSGIAVDGIDFSTLKPLIDGSNADDLHKHLLLQDFEYQFLSPEFQNSITSGVQPGWLEATYDEVENRTQQSWFALQDIAKSKIVIRPYVPIGYKEIDNIFVYSRVSSGAGATNVNAKIYDTEGIKVGEAHHIRNPVLDKTVISGIRGTFIEKAPYRVEVDLLSELGIGAHISDIIVTWRT